MRLTRDSIIPWGCVFKVTFPNDKIYVGSDSALSARLDFFKYFGSPKSAKLDMLCDLAEFLDGDKPYVVRKEILFAQKNIRVGELLRVEQQFIRSLDARNPEVGYNR